MNVRTFEIHDVFMVAKKIEVTTAQNIEGQVSNIHNLLIDLYTAIRHHIDLYTFVITSSSTPRSSSHRSLHIRRRAVF